MQSSKPGLLLHFVSAVIGAAWEEGPKVTLCNPFNSVREARASAQHGLWQFRQDNQGLRQALPYLILSNKSLRDRNLFTLNSCRQEPLEETSPLNTLDFAEKV